jgi:hypothetical protein
MMELMAPTPRKALRQPRNASLSSERLTACAAAIHPTSSSKMHAAGQWNTGIDGHRRDLYPILALAVQPRGINLTGLRILSEYAEIRSNDAEAENALANGWKSAG